MRYRIIVPSIYILRTLFRSKNAGPQKPKAMINAIDKNSGLFCSFDILEKLDNFFNIIEFLKFAEKKCFQNFRHGIVRYMFHLNIMKFFLWYRNIVLNYNCQLLFYFVAIGIVGWLAALCYNKSVYICRYQRVTVVLLC